MWRVEYWVDWSEHCWVEQMVVWKVVMLVYLMVVLMVDLMDSSWAVRSDVSSVGGMVAAKAVQ